MLRISYIFFAGTLGRYGDSQDVMGFLIQDSASMFWAKLPCAI